MATTRTTSRTRTTATTPTAEPAGPPQLVAPLATSVVGSYSVPEWLERLKTDYYQRRISGAYLGEIHEVAIKAALKDQESAGVDIVSDGELRRDNDVDYFLARMPGVEILQQAKAFYADYYDAVVAHPIPEIEEGEGLPLGLAEDFKFTQRFTDHPIKFSFTGPFSLSRRVRNEAYKKDDDLVMALARILNIEAKALSAEGVKIIQIDEPFLAGYPEQVPLAVKAFNTVFDGIDNTKTGRAVHVCYGNRNARPQWEGHYDFLFPRILDAQIDQLVLEFARKGYDDLDLIKKYSKAGFALGLGVINVKSNEIERADEVATRIQWALKVLPPERIMVNPDCGLRNLPSDIAMAKLRALCEGAAIARREVMGAQ
jgi:5-methyltetrahydropteroyltriglutamate--homocysteine methyltransferase